MSEKARLDIEDVNGVTVVRFQDKDITDSVLIAQLRDTLSNQMKPNQGTQFLLNLAEVEFFGTTMLNELVTLNNKTCRGGGVVRICCAQPQIRDLFTLTRLDRVFDITETEADGLQLF